MAQNKSPMTILVAFATADTGSKAVELLSQNSADVAVTALVRDPAKPRAQALAALAVLPRVTVVKGDCDHPATLSTALKGVNRMLLVTGVGEEAQADREITLIKAAVDAGVEAIVRIAAPGWLIAHDAPTVYGRAHAKIRDYIREHKAPVIDLGANWYMSNWLGFAGEIKGLKRISWPVKPDNKSALAMLDTRDVAGAAVALLLLPSDKLPQYLEARVLELNGPQRLTIADKLKAIEEVVGHPLELNYVEPDQWVEMLQGFGFPKPMAETILSTALVAAGEVAPPQPPTQDTSPLLLDIYTPKYTVHDWARDHKKMFA